MCIPPCLPERVQARYTGGTMTTSKDRPISKDRHDRWDTHKTYVIGHQRPDTDAIASALGYAWFLKETGHDSARASRTGQPGERAVCALRRFEQPLPALLTAVAPTFWHVAAPPPAVLPDTPLSVALSRLGSG